MYGFMLYFGRHVHNPFFVELKRGSFMVLACNMLDLRRIYNIFEFQAFCVYFYDVYDAYIFFVYITTMYMHTAT